MASCTAACAISHKRRVFACDNTSVSTLLGLSQDSWREKAIKDARRVFDWPRTSYLKLSILNKAKECKVRTWKQILIGV